MFESDRLEGLERRLARPVSLAEPSPVHLWRAAVGAVPKDDWLAGSEQVDENIDATAVIARAESVATAEHDESV